MLTTEQVEKIAQLSRLSLTDKEIEKYTNDLSGILDLFEDLQNVNTDGVVPTAQITGLQNITQEDEVSSEDISIIPSSPRPVRDDMVSVPNVF